MIADAALGYHRFASIACRNKNVPSLNTDILHLFLKDGLINNFQRAFAPEVSLNDAVPTFQISIAPENLNKLNSDLPVSGKSQYYKAYVQHDEKSYTVKARYMGDNYWHWLYPQKSWRIKTKKSKLIENRRKINIKNPRFIIPFNQCLAQDLAHEIGLIAPRIFPVKFVLNNQYMGLYLYWETIDESVIRDHNKMPGSIYSGDGAPNDTKTHVSKLWKEDKWWEKIGSRNAEQKENREDIKKLIYAINELNLNSFYKFCNQYIDKEMFSTSFSLDSFVGTQTRDYHHNHKIYFDPITGKFTPISWDMNNWWTKINELDVSSSALLNKWKLIPEFEHLRLKKLYDLLQNEFNYKNLDDRINKYNSIIFNPLLSDGNRDAKSYINAALKFPVVFVRPFTIKKYTDSLDDFKQGIRNRINFLTQYFNESILIYFLEKQNNKYILRILMKGNVGRKITSIKINGEFNTVSILRDVNRNRRIDSDDVLIGTAHQNLGLSTIQLNENIFPGYKKVPRPVHPCLGTYKLESSPIEYNYILNSPQGKITSVQIFSQNIVTGQQENSIYQTFDKDVIRVVKETVSLHPWDLPPKPEIEQKVLGPGLVTVQEDLVFEENIELTILPGTTFQLAEGVSMFCYGKVKAQGTFEKPITFETTNPDKPWGVFALQGSGADDSRFEWCSWQDGSIDERNLINYSGMVSMHDVDNLTIENCRVGRNHIGDDGLHLAYCNNFIVNDSLFEDARSDAFDIDISNGKVISSRFVRSGNDSLDFMTSEAVVDRCYFEDSGDKGISVGEKSKLNVDGSVFEHCNIGMEIKDQSIVDFKQNVIRNSPIAINLYKKNWQYNGGGKLIADTVFAVNCSKGIEKDKKSEVIFNRVETNDPLFSVWSDTEKMAGCCTPTPIQERVE